jgi:hypothetical protein
MTECLVSLTIREMQITTRRRHHIIPVRMLLSKSHTAGENVERKEPLYTVGKSVK